MANNTETKKKEAQAQATEAQAQTPATNEPEIKMMLKIMGVKEPDSPLTPTAYAKSVMAENKARTAANTALADRIIAEVVGGQSKVMEIIGDNMKVTKACHDKTIQTLEARFTETKKSLEKLEATKERPLASWTWITAILVAIFLAIIVFRVAMKLDPFTSTILGVASGVITFMITYLVDQYGRKE